MNQKIELHIKIVEDKGYSRTCFVTHFILPDGETIYKDINKPEKVGFEELIPYEGQLALLIYSDGGVREAILNEVTDDDLTISFIEDED